MSKSKRRIKHIGADGAAMPPGDAIFGPAADPGAPKVGTSSGETCDMVYGTEDGKSLVRCNRRPSLEPKRG